MTSFPVRAERTAHRSATRQRVRARSTMPNHPTDGIPYVEAGARTQQRLVTLEPGVRRAYRGANPGRETGSRLADVDVDSPAPNGWRAQSAGVRRCGRAIASWRAEASR